MGYYKELLEESSNQMEDISNTIASPLLDTRELRHSGRIVRAPEQFMFLGEVISNDPDLNPSNYNETISDKDLENWQSAMKVKNNIYMIEPYNFIGKSQ